MNNENEENHKSIIDDIIIKIVRLDFDNVIFYTSLLAIIGIIIFLCVNFGADGVKLSIIIAVAFFSVPNMVALVLWGGVIVIVLFKLLSLFVGLF